LSPLPEDQGHSADQPAAADWEFQDRILPGVSRTFALTIPELPEGIRPVVANGYLLCRIADTIEDEPALSLEQKQEYHQEFAAVVAGVGDGAGFARRLAPLLSGRTSEAERELVKGAAGVVRICRSFPSRPRAALVRCVGIMCEGMPRFQGRADGRRGLDDLAEMHAYCYVVAGVVGEMLTELFCSYAPDVDANRDQLAARAVAFGYGLQMTNILKDIWDDWPQGFCWLPRDVFARWDFDLAHMDRRPLPPGFQEGLGELLGVAHGHLKDALEYTLLIPPAQAGMRRFCLRALGMSVLTLRRVNGRRGFLAGNEVKITRRTVKMVVGTTDLLASRDTALRLLFWIYARGLPPVPARTGS
jgi:farnesyl-diphosphate farnesyltransferase